MQRFNINKQSFESFGLFRVLSMPSRCQLHHKCKQAWLNQNKNVCLPTYHRLPFAEGQAHLNLFLQLKGCTVGLPYNDMTFERQSPLFQYTIQHMFLARRELLSIYIKTKAYLQTEKQWYRKSGEEKNWRKEWNKTFHNIPLRWFAYKIISRKKPTWINNFCGFQDFHKYNNRPAQVVRHLLCRFHRNTLQLDALAICYK